MYSIYNFWGVRPRFRHNFLSEDFFLLILSFFLQEILDEILDETVLG